MERCAYHRRGAVFVTLLIACLTATSTDASFIMPTDKSPENSFEIAPDTSPSVHMKDSAYVHVWPDLEFNWRVVVGTIIAFVGGSLGCAGGVGGGGIFVPTLILIVGFDQKSSTALSKCMIMGASAASVWYNFRLESAAPTIDYDLSLIFQPMLVLGISIGVVFNVIFPNWLVTILLIILFTGTSLKTLVKAVSLWKKESIEKMLDEAGKTVCISSEAVLDIGEYEELQPTEVHNPHHMYLNINWKGLAALFFVWISFLILQILKNNSETCSSFYWIWSILQVPVAVSVFFMKAVSLYIRNKKPAEEQECLISATQVQWTVAKLVLCALAALLAGIIGGLLGLGGGFILGPLLLELGVTPQVASATATFVMLFSSSMSVIEYYLLHRFPVPFALYLFLVNAAAGFCAQYVIQRIVSFFGRASIIVFLLSFLIFASAICLGGYGIEDTIMMLENKEYMGFLNLCSA